MVQENFLPWLDSLVFKIEHLKQLHTKMFVERQVRTMLVVWIAGPFESSLSSQHQSILNWSRRGYQLKSRLLFKGDKRRCRSRLILKEGEREREREDRPRLHTSEAFAEVAGAMHGGRGRRIWIRIKFDLFESSACTGKWVQPNRLRRQSGRLAGCSGLNSDEGGGGLS